MVQLDSKFRSAISRTSNATQRAFQIVHRNMATPSDPDLEIYQSLKPEDFASIMQRFGVDNTLHYIRTMEAKRLQVK